MFRRSFLPCAWFGLALGLVVVAAPTLGWSQDRSTDERLDRLERDLNMLQRQVYRGAPPPAAVADSGGAVNTEVRMERLEDGMRDLTGRVEELMNQINQVRQRVQQVSSDVEVRFSQLSPAAPAAEAGPPSRAAARYPAPSDDELTPPGSPPHAPPPVFGMLTPPGERAPAAAPAHADPGTAGAEAKGELPGASVGAQYNHAFGLLKKADYDAAETALKEFVEHHPKDTLAGNAQYWLGETYYARRRYIEAASAFAEGYKRYPKSSKAADDLLKLGMSLARAHQKDNACIALGQLTHDFPSAAASVREHASAEKRRLGC